MNNRLEKREDQHNQHVIFESKKYTHYGFCQFLSCVHKEFFVQTRCRCVESKRDKFFLLDFRIDSPVPFTIGNSNVNILIDGENQVFSFIQAESNFKTNVPKTNFNLWGYCEINEKILLQLCEATELKIRIFVSIGYIDLKMDSSSHSHFIAMLRHLYNGVIDNDKYIPDLKTKIPNHYPVWKIFFKTLGWPNTIGLLLTILSLIFVVRFFSNADKPNIESNYSPNKEERHLNGNIDSINKIWVGKDFKLFIEEFGNPINSSEYNEIQVKGGDQYLDETYRDLEKLRNGSSANLETIQKNILLDYSFDDLYKEFFNGEKSKYTSVHVIVDKKRNVIMDLKLSNYSSIK